MAVYEYGEYGAYGTRRFRRNGSDRRRAEDGIPVTDSPDLQREPESVVAPDVEPATEKKGRNEVVRHLLTFTLLVILTVSFYVAALIFPEITLGRVFLTLLAITVVYIIFTLIRIIVIRRIRDKQNRYSFRRTLSILYYVVIGTILLSIWINTNYILVAYGIIGAGIAIALQDVFKNFAGGFMLIFSRTYRVGDRIEIEETMGDVMDIGIFTTTILEIHAQGVKGDQPTGRITTVPNGAVLSTKIFNFSRDHTFIWDEISIPITYGSDWRKADALFLDIVRAATEEIAARAERDIERIGERYYLPRKVVEPSTYLTLTDNWITFDIRYVTEIRNRRILKSDLSRKLLEAVEVADDIHIATESLILYEGGPANL
jgi:small-conductance mechanosensitive channel